jgi:hypothetical protein
MDVADSILGRWPCNPHPASELPRDLEHRPARRFTDDRIDHAWALVHIGGRGVHREFCALRVKPGWTPADENGDERGMTNHLDASRKTRS